MMLMRSTMVQTLPSCRNILLRQLSRFDQSLIEPHLEELPVRSGTTLFSASDSLDSLYFPNSAFFSLEEAVSRSEHLEIGVVGCEGLLGWPILLGCERPGHAAIAQMRTGTVLRISSSDLRNACVSSPTLWAALLRFVQIMIVQMGRTITSHLEDSLDRRIARWLLMRHDRVGGDELIVRHEEVATSLSVRRASITDKFHILEGERLIKAYRGRLLVRDRAGLETFAGPAYGVAEAHYRDLIAPFGKSAIDYVAA